LFTWQGLKKGKRDLESGRTETTKIVGATLMESTTMLLLSEALRENAVALRENTAEIKRRNDIALLMHQNP
jgi:hypothetical protein